MSCKSMAGSIQLVLAGRAAAALRQRAHELAELRPLFVAHENLHRHARQAKRFRDRQAMPAILEQVMTVAIDVHRYLGAVALVAVDALVLAWQRDLVAEPKTLLADVRDEPVEIAVAGIEVLARRDSPRRTAVALQPRENARMELCRVPVGARLEALAHGTGNVQIIELDLGDVPVAATDPAAIRLDRKPILAAGLAPGRKGCD
jgi:hypothetical protein